MNGTTASKSTSVNDSNASSPGLMGGESAALQSPLRDGLHSWRLSGSWSVRIARWQADFGRGEPRDKADDQRELNRFKGRGNQPRTREVDHHRNASNFFLGGLLVRTRSSVGTSGHAGVDNDRPESSFEPRFCRWREHDRSRGLPGRRRNRGDQKKHSDQQSDIWVIGRMVRTSGNLNGGRGPRRGEVISSKSG